MRRHFYVLSILIVCLDLASGNELTCVSCPDSLYLDQALFACQTYPVNSRPADPANASSMLECACEAGYTNGSAVCGPCALGAFKPALGNVTCDLCPALTNTTATGRQHITKCLCVQGFSLDIIDCVPCNAGTSKDYIGNDACTVRPPGMFCPQQSVTPVSCVTNSTQAAQRGKRNIV